MRCSGLAEGGMGYAALVMGDGEAGGLDLPGASTTTCQSRPTPRDFQFQSRGAATPRSALVARQIVEAKAAEQPDRS